MAHLTRPTPESTPPARPQKPEDLDFKPFQPMVRWFTPSELVRAGVKTVISSLFGAYADRRELQALQTLREDQVYFDYSKAEDLWVDYIADLGDGWDPTYAMARLVAEPHLALPHTEGGVEQVYATQRGRVLVMGGDQVYPTATRDAYQNRLLGPYRAALPWVPEAEAPPHLYAVPGNHDWYDGLTSFARTFCQGRWIGGWKTRQPRSYFALKLPHDWWLWGIDVQLESDVDLPQYKFFEALAGDPDVMKPGSRIILCTAEPAWVYHEQQGPRAYRNLAHFEDKLIRAHGHEHVIGLAGDLHTYARYERPEDGRQRFVSGGGGAYLYPSHNLPRTLELPEGDHAAHSYQRKSTFPDARTSRSLALRSLLFAWDNKKFAFFLGLIYFLATWVILSIISTGVSTNPEQVFTLETTAGSPLVEGLPAVFERIWAVLAVRPGATFQLLVLLLLLTAGFYGFADSKKTPLKLALGFFHAALHLATLFGLMGFFAYVNVSLFGALAVDNAFLELMLFAVELVLIGGPVGGVVMGLYLFLSNLLFGVHSNEVFLCQSLPDYKHFIRLHITQDGVVVYPVGMRRVPRAWDLKPTGAPGDAWFEPRRGSVAERAALIEAPILIPRRSRPERRTSSVERLEH